MPSTYIQSMYGLLILYLSIFDWLEGVITFFSLLTLLGFEYLILLGVDTHALSDTILNCLIQARSLGQEDPLEEGLTTHSRILAHGQRSLVGFSQWSCKELNMTQQHVPLFLTWNTPISPVWVHLRFLLLCLAFQSESKSYLVNWMNI